MSRRARQQLGAVVRNVILILISLFQLFPLLVMFFNSFRTDKEIKNMPLAIPTELHLENYVNPWQSGDYPRAFFNSITMAVFVVMMAITMPR